MNEVQRQSRPRVGKRGVIAVILFLLFLLKGILYLIGAGWLINRITG